MACITECASPRIVTVRPRSASESGSSAPKTRVQPSSQRSSSALRVAGGSTNSLSRSRSGFSPSDVKKSVQRDRILPAMCFTNDPDGIRFFIQDGEELFVGNLLHRAFRKLLVIPE